MDQDTRLIFQSRFVNMALELCLSAALRRLANLPDGYEQIDSLEEEMRASVQSLITKGPVSDVAMQQCFQLAIKKLELAFDRVRKRGDLPP